LAFKNLYTRNTSNWAIEILYKLQEKFSINRKCDFFVTYAAYIIANLIIGKRSFVNERD